MLTLKPIVPHPALLPTVISLKPAPSKLYNKGFKNPRDPRPALNLASLSIATNPAKAGDDAEVPPIRTG